MLVWLCVFVRVVANPFSNVFQKLLTRQFAHALSIVCVTHGLLTVACVPFLAVSLPPVSFEFWSNISVSALLCVAGNVLIVLALENSDLSVLGPINAYKSVISLIPGMILLAEFPGLLGLIGIGLIIVGSYFLLDQKSQESGATAMKRFFTDRGIQYRLAALVFSALEAVYLKKALRASSSTTAFAYWCVLGFVISLATVAVLLRREQSARNLRIFRKNGLTVFLLAVTTGLMQLCTLFVLEYLKVGYALALFQTSTLISVLLGYHLFQEPHLLKRLTGSAIMVMGAILIIVAK